MYYLIKGECIANHKTYELQLNDEDTRIDIKEYTHGTSLQNLRNGETITAIGFSIFGYG